MRARRECPFCFSLNQQRSWQERFLFVSMSYRCARSSSFYVFISVNRSVGTSDFLRCRRDVYAMALSALGGNRTRARTHSSLYPTGCGALPHGRGRSAKGRGQDQWVRGGNKSRSNLEGRNKINVANFRERMLESERWPALEPLRSSAWGRRKLCARYALVWWVHTRRFYKVVMRDCVFEFRITRVRR